MLVIFGTRGRKKVLDQGLFFSPAVGRRAPYLLLEVRRWFTLFFIPIIPLKSVATAVECCASGTLYDPRILDRPDPEQLAAQFRAALREIVAGVALADGSITTDERRRALAIVTRRDATYTAADFDADVMRAATTPVAARLDYLASTLNQSGKTELLTAAAFVMAADGSADGNTRAWVAAAGARLRLPTASIDGTIAAFAGSRAPAC